MSETKYRAAKYIRLSYADDKDGESNSVENQRKLLDSFIATQPDIEVIILTGHGNETDRETCMGLGAFAYLQKPVDIDVLSETMKRANEKIQARKQARQGA